MKHKKNGRKFGRECDQRKALLKGLASSLIKYEKISTTKAKAKETSSFVEKLITSAKKDDLSAIRRMNSKLSKEAALKISKMAPVRYKDRNGGYTRIINLGQRKTDGAEMAIIELV